jgi:hypothetical protein
MVSRKAQRASSAQAAASPDQAFVVNESSGTWGNAEEVPGTPALNAGGDAYANSISCAAVNHCVAGGYYTESSKFFEPYVVHFRPS